MAWVGQQRFNSHGGVLELTTILPSLADELIPPNGSLNYYHRVQKITPDTSSYFRYFEVPGIAHCMGGDGAFPLTAMNSLVDWVEKGKAPDHLDGQSIPMFSSNPDAEPYQRPICAYPKVAVYKGGDVRSGESFRCEEGFMGGKGGGMHDEL